MARGSFDPEIKQAMAPDGGDTSAPTGQPAKSASSSGAKAPPAANASQFGKPKPAAAIGIRLPHPSNDPVAHAASIAHAILAHGRGGGY